MRVSELATGKQRFEAALPSKLISVAISADGRLLALRGRGRDRDISVFDVTQGSTTQLSRGEGEGPFATSAGAMVFLRRGELLAAEVEDRVQLWDVARRRILAECVGQGPLAAAPNGQTLAIGQGIRIWNTASEASPGEPLWPDRGSRALAFSADGRFLAAGGQDGSIMLFDIFSGHALATLNAHQLSITHLAFSSDGRTLASGSLDGIVRLWNLATHSELFVLEDWGNGGPLAVVFSADGKTLVTAGSSVGNPGRVSLWSGHAAVQAEVPPP